jgi:hypothetical protein
MYNVLDSHSARKSLSSRGNKGNDNLTSVLVGLQEKNHR